VPEATQFAELADSIMRTAGAAVLALVVRARLAARASGTWPAREMGLWQSIAAQFSVGKTTLVLLLTM
jgi:hypothetical protein